MPNPKSEREHGPLTPQMFRSASGLVFIRQPSGALYVQTREGLRRVSDDVVAAAEAKAKGAA